jgi:hypothetical protein
MVFISDGVSSICLSDSQTNLRQSFLMVLSFQKWISNKRGYEVTYMAKQNVEVLGFVLCVNISTLIFVSCMW